MYEIQANTQVIVPVGPFVDVGDGFTPETGITLGAADEAELLKHGSTTVVDISGATWAAISSMDGYYALTITTALSDTEGMLTVAVHDDSVCLPVVARFMVLSQAAYISKYTAKDTGFMDVDVKAISADTTAADNAELFFDGTGYAGTNNVIPTVTTVSNQVTADMTAISGDTTAANNAESFFDGTGYAGTNNVIPTVTTNTDMVGTDNAALASVLGALNDAAAAGDPTSSDTVMQYVKQLINLIVGTAGVGTWPAEQAPANAINLLEAVRAIATDVSTTIPGTISTAQSDLDTITGADGTTLATSQGNYAPATASALSTHDGKLDTAQTDLDTLTGADGATLATSQGNYAPATPAQVNAQVVDVLNVDTFAEPTGVPAATASIVAKLGTLYMMARNKVTVTASKKQYFGDDDAAEFEKDLSDDATTYTESELNAP